MNRAAVGQALNECREGYTSHSFARGVECMVLLVEGIEMRQWTDTYNGTD